MPTRLCLVASCLTCRSLSLSLSLSHVCQSSTRAEKEGEQRAPSHIPQSLCHLFLSLSFVSLPLSLHPRSPRGDITFFRSRSLSLALVSRRSRDARPLLDGGREREREREEERREEHPRRTRVLGLVVVVDVDCCSSRRCCLLPLRQSTAAFRSGADFASARDYFARFPCSSGTSGGTCTEAAAGACTPPRTPPPSAHSPDRSCVHPHPCTSPTHHLLCSGCLASPPLLFPSLPEFSRESSDCIEGRRGRCRQTYHESLATVRSPVFQEKAPLFPGIKGRDCSIRCRETVLKGSAVLRTVVARVAGSCDT